MKEESVPEKPLKAKKNGKSIRKALGPVGNLEEYVRPDWWRRIFNSLYLKTDADVVDDQKITEDEVSFFINILKPKNDEFKILDLCCGQGRHAIEFARRGFKNVHGLDRSHYLIQRAKVQSKKEGLDIRFKEGDARKLPYPTDTFDVVMILGNSFGYFDTLQDDVRILTEVSRILKPWGTLLIDVADGQYLKENFQPRSWEWIDKKYFVCRERSLSKDGQRLISREIINHAEKGVLEDQFYAERLYTQESITEVLKSAGFSDVSFNGEISPNSQRNQDLGMMERRLIVTGVTKKEWTSKFRRDEKDLCQVTVILGDPKKPDKLKPGSIFDDDDYYTINQMKEAMNELKNYQFSFLDEHNNLISELTRRKGRIDYIFNLCDEGYNNDPRKELHIPGLLEILGIPYTGSNPQCLAYCYDKSLVRGIAKEMNIPVPDAFFINPEDTAYEINIGFPVLVKPNYGDSSFGITQNSYATNIEELVNAIAEIRGKFGYEKPILVEEFLSGKDISVGIIGNPPESYTVLPVIEEDYSALPSELPRICGYEAKWQPDSPYWQIKSIPANLPEETEKVLIEWCTKLFERLDVRDYCRLDWRLNSDGTPKLLEVNPNPGWCWDGHLAKMAKLAGLSYKDMLAMILKAAEQRLKIMDEAVKEWKAPS